MNVSSDRQPAPYGHAVVIGSGIAGLLAARSLSESFARVVIVERDAGPWREARKGVPQGRHAHALLVRGLSALEKMFPGFAAEAVAHGAVAANAACDASWGIGGGRLLPARDRLPVIVSTRPFLEGEIRARVMALPNCSLMAGHVVEDFVCAAGARRVAGVTLRAVDDDTVSTLPADLVVDASGRASRLPAWLDRHGYQPPPEQALEVGVGYTTAQFVADEERLGGRRAVIVGATPACPRSGVVHVVEGGRIEVSLAGYRDNHPPATYAGFVEFAKSLALPDIHELIAGAKPCSDLAVHRVARTWRRRYEVLRDFPAGVIALGDAVCAFNPIFAQGMSIAALQAEALAAALACEPRDRRAVLVSASLAAVYFRAIARLIEPAWAMARSNDLLAPHLAHMNSFAGRLLSWWVGRVLETGTRDAEIARRFVRIASLADPPAALLAPGVVRRVAFPRPAPAAGNRPEGRIELA
jgi:2-polyprenyl-6-methoxyphenol hydroxylase-like FAD-dependent oxidoreductase